MSEGAPLGRVGDIERPSDVKRMDEAGYIRDLELTSREGTRR